MFKKYSDMGFEKTKFITDFKIFKCSNEELENLRNHFKYFGKINPNGIDFFIGKLVAMLCDPNSENNYSRQLAEFEAQNTELYKIVYDLVENTKQFDIAKNDFLNSYRDISSEFYEKLKNWITRHLN